MKRILNLLLEKIRDRYDHASIRYIISFSFTVVAIVGMLIVGVSFYLKSIHTTETMVLENNKAM
ncbi:sensor histidine kinase, partial [Clostridium saudiense]|nr:sensor histidine kinase [Clostridium saudiense]